ncbi:Histone-lysine N-methyltransferase SETMAR, partial [Ooceraea biroi]
IYYVIKKGKNTVQTTKDICVVYGSNAVAERIVQKWFARFKRVDFNIENEQRSDRPSTENDNQIAALIKSNPHYTT